MNDALMSALVGAGAALAGAFVGAWAVFRADDRRREREGASLRLAVLTDLVRWSEVCTYAATDGRRILAEPGGMAWKETAAIAAAHLPRKLFTLFFGVQQERDQSELVDASLVGPPGLSAREFFVAQFALRRFVIIADEFTRK